MTNIIDQNDHSFANDLPDQDQIDRYRKDGYLVVHDVFSGDDLTALRTSVEAAVDAESSGKTKGDLSTYERIFDQKVNIWSRHADIARHTLAPRLGRMAAALEGQRMRIWHDQALFKQPGLANNRTPWHQDSVYWPHKDRWRSITIWIALEDATLENGCMSFLPGSQCLGPLDPIALEDPADIFAGMPHLRAQAPVPCPLRAGSVTFHNGLTWHCAGPNTSDATRKAYAIIFMPENTIYTGAPHVLTDGMDLPLNTALQGESFPQVG